MLAYYSPFYRSCIVLKDPIYQDKESNTNQEQQRLDTYKNLTVQYSTW